MPAAKPPGLARGPDPPEWLAELHLGPLLQAPESQLHAHQRQRRRQLLHEPGRRALLEGRLRLQPDHGRLRRHSPGPGDHPVRRPPLPLPDPGQPGQCRRHGPVRLLRQPLPLRPADRKGQIQPLRVLHPGLLDHRQQADPQLRPARRKGAGAGVQLPARIQGRHSPGLRLGRQAGPPPGLHLRRVRRLQPEGVRLVRHLPGLHEARPARGLLRRLQLDQQLL